VRLINLDEGETVAAVARIAEADEPDEENGDAETVLDDGDPDGGSTVDE
jgi:hypothetical protein